MDDSINALIKWKEFYFDNFYSTMPSLSQCIARMNEDPEFSELEDKESKIEVLAGDLNIPLHEDDLIDHNTFSSLCVYLKEKSELFSTICTLNCTASCSRCNKMNWISSFFSNEKKTFSPTCKKCRKDFTAELNMDKLYFVLDLDILDGCIEKADLRDIALKLCKAHYDLSKRTSLPFEGHLFSTSPIIFHTLLSSSVDCVDGDENEMAEDEFVESIMKHEIYQYRRNGGSKTKRFFICSQSTLSKCRTKARTAKQKSTRTYFECGGGISFSYKANRYSVSLVHCMHHVNDLKNPLDAECIQKIQKLCNNGFSPFQILNLVHQEGHFLALYDDVYRVWKSMMVSHFKKNENPRTSSLHYLEQSKELHLIHFQERPWGIAFSTDLGDDISGRFRLEELFIDSTHKTNNEGLELFVIIGFVLGVGFPLAYFILEPGTGEMSREDSLTNFLSAYRKHRQHVKPSFFFTDKEPAQIAAIINVFKINPSLCLWHVKRAIKRKIVDAKKKNLSSLSEEDEVHILKLIGKHYFEDTVTTGKSCEEVYESALSDLQIFFNCRPSERELYSYFQTNWYTKSWWVLWGRRHSSKIALSRTTMKVESHWLVLKKHFLMAFNRPRVDLLVHVIGSKLMFKFFCDFQSIHDGSKKPYVWKEFLRQWKKCQLADEQNVYRTNHDLFVCDCPAWKRSQFFLCKHLVKKKAVPKYNEVSINRSPPFIVIEPNMPRTRMNIDNEELTLPSDSLNISIGSITTTTSLRAVVPELFSDLNFQNDEDEGCSIEAVTERLNDIVTWLRDHIDDQAKKHAVKQLLHLERKVLPRLLKYQKNVTLDINSRGTSCTWANADVQYLK